MRVNGNQFRRGENLRVGSVKGGGQGFRLASPFVEPEPAVLHVEQYALAGKVEPLSQGRVVTATPVWKSRAAWKCRLKKFPEIGWKAKPEALLATRNFLVREPRIEI